MDLDAPDFQTYPKSALLRPREVVLRPGDALLFPRYTAHTTTTLSDSVSLSFRLSQA